jgi:hypothetical protein
MKGELTKTYEGVSNDLFKDTSQVARLKKIVKSLNHDSNPAEIQTWNPLNKSEYCYTRPHGMKDSHRI